MNSFGQPPVLPTTAGDLPLGECKVEVGGRHWSVLYTASTVSCNDEAQFLAEQAERIPYGVALWSSAIALAHEIATRLAEFNGRSVLELGAGTGLPGIVAASAGATVVQTDRNELAIHLCRLNGKRNQVNRVEYRPADWTAWKDDRRYDWVIGSDILYAETYHPNLRRIFENNLTPEGHVLLADPYRAPGLALLEKMAADRWQVAHSRWSIGDEEDVRPIAVYELTPPLDLG